MNLVPSTFEWKYCLKCQGTDPTISTWKSMLRAWNTALSLSWSLLATSAGVWRIWALSNADLHNDRMPSTSSWVCPTPRKFWELDTHKLACVRQDKILAAYVLRHSFTVLSDCSQNLGVAQDWWEQAPKIVWNNSQIKAFQAPSRCSRGHCSLRARSLTKTFCNDLTTSENIRKFQSNKNNVSCSDC